MIKKLRIRFVAIFMISMSILVFTVMGCVFAFMSNSEAYATQQLLQKIASAGGLETGVEFNNQITQNDTKDEQQGFLKQIQRDAILVHFSSMSIYPISYECEVASEIDADELYETALKLNIKRGSVRRELTGNVKLSDKEYRYLLTNNVLVLVDKSYEADMLKRLLTILLISGVVAFAVLLAISIILARWTTAPVERAWQKQREFVADASHELRTPLTVIDANIDVVINNSDDTVENQKKWLSNIKDETKSMALLVNDLLYIAKTDARRDKFEPTEFNLSNLIENSSLGFESLAFEKGKNYSSNIEADIIYNGDKNLINQLVKILLDNAIKYSAEKGNIFLELKKTEKNKIYLVVSNDGEILSEEDKQLVFERFYRTDKSRARETGGTGLGLSIAKSIVNRHNGTITIQTIDSKYNSFVVTL